jgi:hypothetical protein
MLRHYSRERDSNKHAKQSTKRKEHVSSSVSFLRQGMVGELKPRSQRHCVFGRFVCCISILILSFVIYLSDCLLVELRAIAQCISGLFATFSG